MAVKNVIIAERQVTYHVIDPFPTANATKAQVTLDTNQGPMDIQKQSLVGSVALSTEDHPSEGFVDTGSEGKRVLPPLFWR